MNAIYLNKTVLQAAGSLATSLQPHCPLAIMMALNLFSIPLKLCDEEITVVMLKVQFLMIKNSSGISGPAATSFKL